MLLKIVFLRLQNWSRLQPYYSSTITAGKDSSHTFSHARKGKRPFQRKALEKGHFPFLTWEKPHLAGGRKSGLTN